MLDVDDMTGRVLDDRLLAGMAGECAVEFQLEAREAVPVDADVAEHLGRHGPLRIAPPFLRIEPEPRQLESPERLRLRRIRLTLDVDETFRAIAKEWIDTVGVQP